jgi:eukaryotic-like serine/threonine-protein kinase
MTWSPDGRYVASGEWNGKGVAQVWDGTTGALVKQFKGGHSKQLHQVVLSPDGTQVLSCARDFSVRLWDWKTAREIRHVDNLDSAVVCVVFSPDGKRFLTGSRDGTVTLRETATFKELAKFNGHRGAVNDVAIAPDGRLGASGGNDHTVRVWPLPPPIEGK